MTLTGASLSIEPVVASDLSFLLRAGERLVEFDQQSGDAAGSGRVAFHLAVPAALGCLCGEGALGGMPLEEPWGVGGGSDEFRAGQVEVAFAGSLEGEPEAVSELEFGLEEVGLEPLHRRCGKSAVAHGRCRWSGDRGFIAGDGWSHSQRCQSSPSTSSATPASMSACSCSTLSRMAVLL